MKSEAQAATIVAAAPQQRQTVLWIIAILLAVIATATIVRSPGALGIKAAYGDTPMLGARGIFAFTGQLDKNSYGLFMMDVDSSNVWCYQYVPATRKLKLVAARSFLYDRYLEDYETAEPTIDQIKGLLERQRAIQQRISRGGIGPAESKDSLGTMLDKPAGARETDDDGRN